jgi:hypothetical protein
MGFEEGEAQQIASRQIKKGRREFLESVRQAGGLSELIGNLKQEPIPAMLG